MIFARYDLTPNILMKMKGIQCNTIMRLPSERLLFKMKARTAITCGLNNHFSSTSHMRTILDNARKQRYLIKEKDMRPVQKRSMLVHTPSMGLIGQGFSIQNNSAGNLLKESEDHSLFFAETFSTSGNLNSSYNSF